MVAALRDATRARGHASAYAEISGPQKALGVQASCPLCCAPWALAWRPYPGACSAPGRAARRMQGCPARHSTQPPARDERSWHAHASVHAAACPPPCWGAQARLAALPGVRDVHPQQRMTRALAWDAGDAEGGCGGGGGSLAERGGPADREVVKRPGRRGPPAAPAPGSVPPSPLMWSLARFAEVRACRQKGWAGRARPLRMTFQREQMARGAAVIAGTAAWDATQWLEAAPWLARGAMADTGSSGGDYRV